MTSAVNALSNFALPGIIMATLGLSFLFYYIAFKFDNDHFFLKFLCLFFGVIAMQLVPNAVINDLCVVHGHQNSSDHMTCYTLESSTGSSLLNITTWFFRVFVTYISIYLFWYWVKQSETFMRYFHR